MDALNLLLYRRSQPKLIAPPPSGEALANIKMAGMRVPDHAALTPWRFILCEGDGLTKLGAIFETSAIANGKSDKEIARASQLPLRAPMIMIVTTHFVAHPKVPNVEQLASASCAVLAMQLAAVAQGFQGMWRTGSYAHCGHVKASLGISADNEIIGFLYLGTPAQVNIDKPCLKEADFFTYL